MSLTILLIYPTYQPEALHVVSRRWRHFHHVVHTAETDTVFQSSPFDKALEHLPAPFTVLLVASDAPHVEETLDSLWPLQVVSIGGLQDEVFLAYIITFEMGRVGRVESLGRFWKGGGYEVVVHEWRVVNLEVRNLRCQSGWRDLVHAPASLHELFGETHVFFLLSAPAR
jgi:hypothetical protein